jgi:hypothetical protein
MPQDTPNHVSEQSQPTSVSRNNRNLVTDIFTTASLGYSFFKHTNGSIIEMAKKNLKPTTFQKATDYINNASVWAERRTPTLIINLYTKIPTRVRSFFSIVLLLSAHVQHGSHLSNKCEDISSKTSKLIDTKKQEIKEIFGPKS